MWNIKTENSFIRSQKKLSIICTRKDYIKVPDQFKKKICVADLNLKINNSETLRQFILKTLKE